MIDGTAGADARAGVVMRVIAVVGVVLGIAVTFVGWRFLGDLERNLDQSLAIGEDGAATLSETIDVADDVVASLDEGLTTLGVTLETVESTLSDSAGVAQVTADLAAALPRSFEDVDAALGTVESLSSAIDTALRGASRIPLGPDYDPAIPLPEAVGNLRTAFEPIGADLRSISDELAAFADGSGNLRTRIDAVQADLERTRTALIDSRRLLDEYRSTADRAGELAAASREDFAQSLGWSRIAMVLLGIFIAVAQFIPWWLGGKLRRNGGDVPADAA